jgi:glycosyltransferase involved in cell wall biosynthesis
MLQSLLTSLINQPSPSGEVEILTEIDGGEITTGNKRNKLIQRASGEYIVFIDDDDEVSPDYVKEILQAAITKPDAIVFSGWMETNGTDRKEFHLSIHYPYTAITRNGRVEYLRYPNHITPIKRSIALQVPFENRTIGEDYAWATALHDQGLIKTEVKIHKQLYYYKFNSNK